MRETHYFIDESGTIDGVSDRYFIVGCYKTDTPEILRSKLSELQINISNDPIFAFERIKFQKQGFHAAENHFDIRSRVYSLISGLNVRAYILIVDKQSDFFKELLKKHTSDEIYIICIEKLLTDRLIKTRGMLNVLIFENYGSKLNTWEEIIRESIDNLATRINLKGFSSIKYSIEVKDKSEILLAIIDYINYIYNQLFNKRPTQRDIENFKVIQPKVALTYRMDKDEFFDKNRRMKIGKY